MKIKKNNKDGKKTKHNIIKMERKQHTIKIKNEKINNDQDEKNKQLKTKKIKKRDRCNTTISTE